MVRHYFDSKQFAWCQASFHLFFTSRTTNYVAQVTNKCIVLYALGRFQANNSDGHNQQNLTIKLLLNTGLSQPNESFIIPIVPPNKKSFE